MPLLFPQKNNFFLPTVITPKAYAHQFARNLQLPPKAVLCPLPALTKHVENHTRWKKYSCLADIYLLEGKNACYVTNFGMGAPAAATITELLVACGVKELFFIGLAAGLQEEVQAADLVLCDESLCADGVSPHYTGRESVRADKKLLAAWGRELKKTGQDFHTGRNWTTDALFRETKREIKHYQKQSVLTAEMETSAVYAIAKKRGVQAAAAYSISDELSRLVWEPHFGDKRIFKRLETLFDAALNIK